MTGEECKTAIKALRQREGLTMKGLSEITGVPYGTIESIESGRDSSINTLRTIARALGKTLYVSIR